MKVFLDTGVLGFLTHPKADLARPCVTWLSSLIGAGATIVVPEICDYELRRKLIHLGSTNALGKLDQLGRALTFENVDSGVWRRAAELWANCRASGQALAPDDALDGDVLLIALTERHEDDTDIVVATTNIKHLDQYVDARNWESIAAQG